MSEAKIPPVPTPRKSKQKVTSSSNDAESLFNDVIDLPSAGSMQNENCTPPSIISAKCVRKPDAGHLVAESCPPEDADDSLYEKPNQCASNDSGNENPDSSQIYEEFSPGAPWQQELVAWLMAREFGSSLPLGTRPLPQATESPSSPEASSLSFMPPNLAQRASLVLSRLNASSPSTRLLVDVGQPPSVPSNSSYSSLKKKKSSQSDAPLACMNEVDRDFLSLFGITPSDARCSDSVLVNTSSLSEPPLIPDSPDNEITVFSPTVDDVDDRICEEFPVVSLRKGQSVRISVDRQDGSLCWLTGSSEKIYKAAHGGSEAQHNHQIHRRMLVSDLLRANVDVKSRHVVHLATMPSNQYAKESPFAYACTSVQSAVALVTCIAKTADAYSAGVVSSANLGSSSGVLCVGKILFRQQSLQPWIQSFAIVTESRHFIIIRPKCEDDCQNKPIVEHSIDLRYVRELRQESAGDGDGSRSLYLRYGTSTASSLYIRSVCACSPAVNCACSSSGCDPCSVQFNAWQTMLESLISDVSSSTNVLAEQRMSESDLPAIVDRILSHLTLSCLTTEGLHRQAGRVRVANDLFILFKRDPWAVRFEANTKDGEAISAHDIVSTLKRFFQSLNCPLLLTGVDEEAEKALSTAWIGAHYNRFGVEARLAEYRNAFSLLHPVARRTLQAMLLHLRTVAALEAQNRMNFLALAASWGPTLMCSQNSGDHSDNRRNESTLRLADVLPHGKSVVAGAIGVVIDLLSEMDSICPLDAMSESVRRDAHVQDIAVRLHLQPQQHKQAGEITLQIEVDLSTIFKNKHAQPDAAISLNSRRRSSHAVHISPRLTAYDLIKQLCTVDEGISQCSGELAVWEYLAGGSLRRPLFPSTRLLDVCCSWATLEPQNLRRDCKFVIEALPQEHEENSLYEMSDAGGSNQLETESIVSFKTSIPCCYGGPWTEDTFSDSVTKLKHWMYINDTEVTVKSMKAAPSALIGASSANEDRQPKGVVRSASAASAANRGSFRSFFSTALSHIQAHRLASQGRIKFCANFNDIGGVYAAHRSTQSNGTSGLVISARPKTTSSSPVEGQQQLPKFVFHTAHILNDQIRDRLLSYFYFSLLSPFSGSGKSSSSSKSSKGSGKE